MVAVVASAAETATVVVVLYITPLLGLTRLVQFKQVVIENSRIALISNKIETSIVLTAFSTVSTYMAIPKRESAERAVIGSLTYWIGKYGRKRKREEESEDS